MDNKTKRKDILVKFVCVLISFGLWIYIYSVENPIKSYKLTGVPVEIINQDSIQNSKLILMPGQNFKVDLTLEGPASEVYRVRSEQFKIVADLSGYAVKKGNNPIPVQIVQYPSSINIKKNESLRVDIELDEYVEKSVPVKLDMDISTKTGFYSFDQVVKPDNVLVSGAASFVNNVKWVVAKGSAKNAEADISMSLPLKAVDEAMKDIKEVNISPSNAEVFIPVKKGKSVAVNVKTKGELTKNLLMKSIEPIPVRVEILGDDNVIKNIESLDTEPVDLSAITGSKDILARLALPKGVTVVGGTDTVSVKVTIEEVNQKNVTINLSTSGLPDTLKATLDKQQVTVVIKAPKSILDGIKEGDVTAALDLTGLVEGEHNLSPKIQVKEGSSLVSSTPEKVKVTITKKE